MLKVTVSNSEGTLAGAVGEYVFGQTDIVAGSEPGADLWLDDLSIAGRHFKVFEQEGVRYLQDLSTAAGYAGTRLNGLVLEGQRPVPVRGEDVIEAGIFRITLGENGSLPAVSGSDDCRSPSLELMGPQMTVKKFVLPPLKEVSLGRSPQADINVPDTTVSRTHATILVSRGGYWLRDQGSANGSFVNSRKAKRPRRLRHGDFIFLGRAQLRFLLPRNAPKSISRLIAERRYGWLLPAAGFLGLIGATVLVVSIYL